MKKLLPLFLFGIAVLFFSCATTGQVEVDSGQLEVVSDQLEVGSGQEAGDSSQKSVGSSQEAGIRNQESVDSGQEAVDSRQSEVDSGQSEVEEEERTSIGESLTVTGKLEPQFARREESVGSSQLLVDSRKSEVEVEADVEVEPVSETEPTSELDGEVAEIAEIETVTKVEPVPETEPKPVPEPEVEKKPAADLTPKAESKPVQKSAAQNRQNPAASTARDNTPPVPLVPAKTDEVVAEEYAFVDESQDEETELPVEEKEPIVPSRTLTVKKNQYVDIIYPGTGWIYLGEEGRGDHFIFRGRKIGNGETMFTLRPKKAGNAMLHFYKNDALTKKYIDDYIEINISNENAFDNAHIVAPSYADVIPPKYERETVEVESEKEEGVGQESLGVSEQNPVQEASSNVELSVVSSQLPVDSSQESVDSSQSEVVVAAEKVQTVVQTAEQPKDDNDRKTSVAGTQSAAVEGEEKIPTALSENPSIQNAQKVNGNADSLLEQAQKAYDEKRYADALDLINQFFDVAIEDIDAGLYLKGLILEAKSEVKNIKQSIASYDTLTQNWPQSNFWQRANERSIYLKRFYVDIR